MSDNIEECCRLLSDSFQFSRDVTCKRCGVAFPNSEKGIQEYVKHLEKCGHNLKNEADSEEAGTQ